MQISLIMTILNEGESIRGLMDSIAVQTRLPDEVVICDGGSRDNTLDIVNTYADRLPLTVIERPGANISEGRNAAIAAAAHDVIAVTDAGVRLVDVWLERITAPFEDDKDCQVVAGFFVADTDTAFEVAMGAAVLPELRDIDPHTFMPSSRSVAFRRAAVEQVGGYPEWLDFCEDLILDFRLNTVAGPFAFASEAVAYFRPRSTLKAFIKQYYQYARGDGKANLFVRRHLIRYMTYLVALPALLVASVVHSPWWLLLLLLGGAVMFSTAYRRLLNQWDKLPAGQKLTTLLWVPMIRITGDFAKMIGYPVGLVWRWRHHPPEWRLEAGGSR